MSRPQQHRRIEHPPLMRGFKPFGISCKKFDSIILKYDEYEAIRLLDYEGMTQEQAAAQMNISRPTLTRIYENARNTTAKAFVEGKVILIEGGNVCFNGDWFRCTRCHKLIDGLENHVKCAGCCNYSTNELKAL